MYLRYKLQAISYLHSLEFVGHFRYRHGLRVNVKCLEVQKTIRNDQNGLDWFGHRDTFL